MTKIIACILALISNAHLLASDSTFVEEEMILKSSTGNLYGSLLVPVETKVPVVAAIIIAGSGPTDRNGNGPGFTNNCLSMLAHELAAQHIATLRFDKRGVGKSAAAAPRESQLDFDMYVTDVLNWIDLLKKDKRISGVFIIGHSEGALIGILASAVMGDGYISIEGAGEPAANILRTQLKSQPSIMQKAMPILDSLESGMQVADIPAELFPLFRPSVQPYLRSWFQYNPCEQLKNIAKPVLILQGDNDIQVNTGQAKRLHKCRPKSKLIIIKGMNHILKITAPNREDNIASYNNTDIPVSKDLIKAIADFIQQWKF